MCAGMHLRAAALQLVAVDVSGLDREVRDLVLQSILEPRPVRATLGAVCVGNIDDKVECAFVDVLLVQQDLPSRGNPTILAMTDISVTTSY